jgi:hypothetical protein
MKKIILFLVLALFALAVVPVSAEKSNTGKSWSKIKDIFK